MQITGEEDEDEDGDEDEGEDDGNGGGAVSENGASVPVVVATSGDYEMIDGSDDDDPDADDDTGTEHYPTGILKLNLEKTFER